MIKESAREMQKEKKKEKEAPLFKKMILLKKCLCKTSRLHKASIGE